MTTKTENAITVETLPLIKFDLTMHGLAKLKKACKAITKVPANTAEYEVLTKQIAQVRNTRGAIEKRRKELKAPLLEWSGKLDGKANELKDALLAMEKPLHGLKDEADAEKARVKEEKATKERERIAAMTAKLDEIRLVPNQCLILDSEAIQVELDKMAALEITPDTHGELAGAAEVARQEALVAMRQRHASKATQEADDRQRQIDIAELETQREALAKQEAEQAKAQAKLDEAQRKLDEAAALAEKEAAEKAAEEKAAKEAAALKRKTKAHQKKLAADLVLLKPYLDNLATAVVMVKTPEAKQVVNQVQLAIKAGQEAVTTWEKETN